jgi:hypothetical protein
MFRSSWSFVLDAKPHGRAITWFGNDAPHGTVYLPFYGAATESAPVGFRQEGGTMAKFDTSMSWWAFNFVSQYQDLNFRAINKDVSAKQRKMESESFVKVAEWEAEVADKPQAEALAILTAKSNAFADAQVAEYWEFAWSLVAKYRGYVVTENSTSENPSGQAYPDWWINSPEVGYVQWTNEGPFHGVILTEADLHPSILAESPTAVAGSLSTGLAVVALLSVVVGGAYWMGLQQGRSSVVPADSYFSVA